MPSYSEIESSRILEELLHTRFEDRGKIDDLIRLAGYVKRGGAQGMAGNMHFHQLKSKYPEEYLSILEEISPERYEAEVQRLADERREKQLREQQKAAQEEQEREDWLKAGGLR